MQALSQVQPWQHSKEKLGDKPLPWQQQLCTQLTAYLKQQRLPHALLFSGQRGLGKLHLARLFAGTLLCEKTTTEWGACNSCHSCQLFHAETHPDFYFLAPEEPGQQIVVGQIRELLDALSLKPHYETFRVVVINSADKMNMSAANAFLKYLEEPTQRTIIILIAEQPFSLPATIHSRCQHLSFSTPNPEKSSSWLQDCQVPEQTKLLLNLANGAPLLALQYAEQNILANRNQCFKAWTSLVNQQQTISEVAKDWLELPPEMLFSWLSSWVMDTIKLACNKDINNLYNPDKEKILQEMAQELDLKCLFNFYDRLLIASSRKESQLNKQLLIEELLIQWSFVTQGH